MQMPKDLPYPNEWPKHLSAEAAIVPVNITPPIGRHLLDFHALGAEGFEQFCWWLLQKEGHLLRGCKRLGGPGLAQEGIDIFACEAHDPDRLIVYECKSGRRFNPTELNEAVEKFVRGDWLVHTKTYILILAKESLDGRLAKAWQAREKELRRKGIDAQVWTAHTLTRRVQAYPDVLSKFFPTYDIRHFANEWMERSDFLDELRRATLDNRTHIRTWAQNLAAKATGGSDQGSESSLQGQGADALVIKRYGNSWSCESSWFHISAFLPGPSADKVSASISLKRPDTSGLTIGLSHEWLISRLLFSTGAPATHEHRGFVVGDAHWHDTEDLVIDLGACRLTLERPGVQLLADASDHLSTDVKRALDTLEQQWESSSFSFVNRDGRRVALLALSRAVWQQVLRFSQVHDVSEGETHWHMFDRSHLLLKPFTESEARHHNRFSPGYHGIFEAVEIENLSFAGELVLLWKPPGWGSPNVSVSDRDWWSCEQAYQWLTRELLPEVKRWTFRQEFESRLSRMLHPVKAAQFASRLDEAFVVRGLKHRELQHVVASGENIVDVVQTLQSFFSIPRTPPPYLKQADVERVFLSASSLTSLQRGHLSYVESKLGLSNSVDDHRQLAERIDDYVRDGRVVANTWVLECAFRAILELMGDDGQTVPPDKIHRLHEALLPFVRLHDEIQFVKRHFVGS